jgi:hypothetical protein
MSLANSGAEPQPSLAWTFESSNVDIVTGLAPSSQVSPGPAQLQGSAALVTNAPTSNTAVYFPGTVNDYMNLGTSTPTNFDASTSNVFFEAWINWSDLTGQQRVYGRYANPQATSSLNLYMRKLSDNTLQVSGGSGSSASNSTALSTGVWYHIAFSSIPGGSSYVFVNGVPGTGTSLTYTAHNAAYNTYIGSGASQYLSGYIRDLRVVQGGVVPTTSFTPGSAPFSYALPSYVTGSGSTVFTLLGQFVTYPPGKYGQGLSTINSLSAVTSYLKYIPSTPITESTGFSISCWVNFLQLPDSGKRMSFVNLSNGTGYGQGVWLAYDRYGSGTFTIYYENTGIGFITPSYNLTATTGTWYHVCGTIGGGSANVYVNGVKGTTVSYSTTGTSYSNIYVCCHVNGAPTPYVVSDEMFSGTMDDLRIYNTALTAAQVRSVYSSQGAPAPSRAMPLPKLAWDFNGTTTPYIGSATSTITGTASYTSGKYNQAILISNPSGTPVNYVVYDISPQVYQVNSGFSRTIWVQFTNLSTLPAFAIFEGVQTSVLSTGMYHYLNASGQIGSNFADGTSTFSTITGPVAQLNTWYHLTTVIFNGTMTYYVNGVVIGSAIYTQIPAVTVQYSTSIGARTTGTLPCIGANIDDLRIFDRALTSAQVQSIYNQQGMSGRGAFSGEMALVSATPLNIQPSYTGTAPIINTSNLSFIRTNSAFLSFGALAIDLTKGFTLEVTFAFTNPNGYERIVDFGSAGYGNNIVLCRNAGANGLYFSVLGDQQVTTPSTITTGTYYNVIASYDPSFGIYLYIDGVLAGSRACNATYTSFPNCYIGKSNNPDPYLSADIQTLKFYNKYRSFPITRTIKVTGTPLFTQLSPSAVASSVGAFSLRAVNGTSARAVNVRNGTTSATQDFYADRLGNLLTAPVTGQSLARWLGGATGYVTTWYDQSGAGNHASQLTAANQPVIQRATKGAGYMVNFNGTSQFVTLSASYNFLNGTNLTLNAVALRTATKAGANFIFGTNSASVNYQRIAIGFESDTTLDPLGNLTSSPGITIPAYSSGEQVYYMTGVLSPSRVVYNNDVVGGTNADTVLLSVPVGTQFSIGSTSAGGAVYYNGNLFELLIFTSALNQTQVTQIYQNQLGAYGT